MVTRKLSLKKIDAIRLLGERDENIRYLVKRFTSRIFARGEKLIIRGEDEEEVNFLADKLSSLMEEVAKGRTITKEDIDNILEGKHEEVGAMAISTYRGLVRPRGPGQEEYVRALRENDIVICIGPAGTGKTYIAAAFAVELLKEKKVGRVILTRPAVEAGERLGFLPGDYREKVDPYLRPLYDALYDLMPFQKLREAIETNEIEVAPLAYMRGRNLSNCFVILDEAQNTTKVQMKMFLTRLGLNARACITGDITQIDLPDPDGSGLVHIDRVLKDIKGIKFVYMTERDVVRHPLVKRILEAYERHGD